MGDGASTQRKTHLSCTEYWWDVSGYLGLSEKVKFKPNIHLGECFLLYLVTVVYENVGMWKVAYISLALLIK